MRIDIETSWLVEQMPSFVVNDAMTFALRREGLPDAVIAKLIASRPAGPVGWDALVAVVQPGDTLWYFQSPKAAWNERAGRSGLAVVRDGAPIYAIVTSMS